ncbi:DUF7373 family lipoprotein [Nocardia sp. CDC160]|uniref:DUF7373 family lipoprotein n=1 Tax=Nocardia sp. CDC160 TaxID=3112166 RepID=UPI002DBA7FA4|nr:hypothetical protein [Nocardia sp. CDC160]MEC3915079.1 hypothetical protein [Nocardia sp. CDC160]
MRVLVSRASVIAVIALVLAAVSACTTTVSGTAVRVPTDPSSLQVGNYQTVPRVVGNAKNDKQSRVRESQRLSDYVALPFEADTDYTYECANDVRPHLVINHKGLGDILINDTFDDVAHDLRGGWVDTWCTGSDNDEKHRKLSIAVLELPDAGRATAVGPTLEHDDFTYNTDNRPLSLPKYPDSKAHWRPSVASIGSWTVHDRYVVFIKIVDELAAAPDSADLIARTERMLDVALPLLDKFTPTPADKFEHMPLDPDGILGRTLPTNPEEPLRPDPDGVYTGRGALQSIDGNDLDFLTIGDIDLVGYGDALVFHSRTGTAAKALWDKWNPATDNPDTHRTIDPPPGFPGDIGCFADLRNGQVVFNQCTFHVDRYNVQVGAANVPVLYQKTSAQYVLVTSR